MGLTIHYDLSLPANSSPALVKKKLEELRQKAKDLPFESVGEMLNFTGDACNFMKVPKDDPNRWLLIQARGNLSCRKDGNIYRVVKKDPNVYCDVVPEQILAFETNPGEGCEPMNVGLCRFPKILDMGNGQKLKTGLNGWAWNSFCKTQYANNPSYGGVANFLRCHLVVVALLDAAIKLGFSVEVADEGDYWTYRDPEMLSGEVAQWDAMIANFGASLNASLGAVAPQLGMQMEIASYPNFAELAIEGAKTTNLSPEKVSAMLQLLIAATAKKGKKKQAVKA